MKRIKDQAHISYKVALESYWENLDVISLNMSQIKRAGDLAETHGLRGYDCVQLAAAEWIFEQSRDVTFASFDQHLNQAARAIGMQTL
jgi:predicted nucleic acid-binding protein